MSRRLLYDGDCGVCERSVGFVRRRAGRRTPESVAYQEAVVPEGWDPSRSVLWVDGDRVLAQSAAVVRVLWSLRGAWPVAGAALWLVPRPLRDLGYRWFARNRHRFGSPACAVGSARDE